MSYARASGGDGNPFLKSHGYFGRRKLNNLTVDGKLLEKFEKRLQWKTRCRFFFPYFDSTIL